MSTDPAAIVWTGGTPPSQRIGVANATACPPNPFSVRISLHVSPGRMLLSRNVQSPSIVNAQLGDLSKYTGVGGAIPPGTIPPLNAGILASSRLTSTHEAPTADAIRSMDAHASGTPGLLL